MKRTFTKEYILSNRGCYDRKEVDNLPFINNKRITLKTLFDGLPVKDFSWFLVRKCDLTLKQKKLFALHCAKQVLPIYEAKYPNDNRVRECIEANEGFINGIVSIKELRIKRAADADAAAAAADADAAAAADAAAYAADAAAYAADADAAAYAYAAAAYAADADAAAYAYADAAYAYRQSIWEFCKTLK